MAAEDMIVCEDLGISFVTTRRQRLKLRDVMIHGAKALEGSGQAFWALRHLNLHVKAGESIGLVGRNGSGKSTLLRLLAGVMLPDEGAVSVNGGIGAMLELSAGFSGDLTGRDNVYLVASLHGFSREQVDEVYDDIVEWCELQRFMDTPVRHYSSGMKARLGFALITQLNEPILLIDEALAVGDRAFRRKCAVVMEEQLSEGRTVMMVSHNENDLERFCTRGIYLKNGAVEFDGSMREALQVYRADSDSENTWQARRRRRMGESPGAGSAWGRGPNAAGRKASGTHGPAGRWINGKWVKGEWINGRWVLPEVPPKEQSPSQSTGTDA